MILFFLIPPQSWAQAAPVPPGALKTYSEAGRWFSAAQASGENDRKALVLYRKTILILESAKAGGTMLADSYTKCGLLEMTIGGQEAGTTDFRRALTVTGTASPGMDSILFQPYLYLGSIAYGHSDLDSARYFYRLAEDIHNRYPGVEGGGRLFNKFGALYYETGDYAQSIGYFEKALAGIDPHSSEYSAFVVNYKNNIATAMMKLGRNDDALRLLRSLLGYHISEDGLFFNLGKASAEKKDFTAAIGYFRGIKKNDAARCNAMARVFLQSGENDSAFIYLDRAAKIERRLPVTGVSLDAALTLQGLGDLSRARPVLQQKEQAARYYQQAIHFLDPAFTDTSLAANPGSFSGLQDFGHLFGVLADKAAVLAELGSQQGDAVYLEQSVDTYKAALSLARHIERTYFSDDARLFLKNQVNPAIEKAVTATLKLYRRSGEDRYLDLAFGFAETSKASVLQTALRNLSLSSIPGLPQPLLQEEKKLKFLQVRLTLTAAATTDTAVLRVMQTRLRDNAIALTAVQEKMDANPAYHQLKYYTSPVTMASLQRRLAGDETILSYYFVQDSLYCFYATNNGHGYAAMHTDSAFFSRIRKLRAALESPGSLDNQTMSALADQLSQVLLKPVLPVAGAKKKWIVVPCNETGYIPFELLPVSGEEKQSLFRHAISYQYSAAMLSDSPALLNQPYRVFSMAPFAGHDQQELAFPALPGSAGEIKDLPGIAVSGKEATKAAFLSQAGHYPVIHLATHAVASDADALGSYIAFYGLKTSPDSLYRLYEQEVYALDLKQVGIIMLSACETGKGQLVNGEGILSLSRAFSYAGCRRVVTSLWKADDRSTAIIMSRLHQYLQQGRDVDEALQLAKTDYLEDPAVAPNVKTPFYWAHLVVIGDHRGLVPASTPWLIWLVSTGLLFSLVALFFLYKNKARQKEFRPAMDMKRISITGGA